MINWNEKTSIRKFIIEHETVHVKPTSYDFTLNYVSFFGQFLHSENDKSRSYWLSLASVLKKSGCRILLLLQINQQFGYKVLQRGIKQFETLNWV